MILLRRFVRSFGTPPVEGEEFVDEISPHGVFPTWYVEVAFLFGASCTDCVADMQPGSDGNTVDGWVRDLSVSISGFDFVHFDLYTITEDASQCHRANTAGYCIDQVAPFSHDASYVMV